MNSEQIERLKQAIDGAESICVLSGAGMSTASGIPDFRSKDGIYTKFNNVEYLLSESYYYRSPKQFWESFKSIFFMNHIHTYEPNIGHEWLARLERAGKQITIVTQNIDGLHSKAGSRHILEVHGTISSAHCPKCKEGYQLDYVLSEDIPRCQKDDMILKPDVVLFEGQVKHLDEAFQAAQASDLFITLGSSLQVYPVKQLPLLANRAGVKSAIVNLDVTEMDALFDIVIYSDITKVASQLLTMD